MDPVLGLFDEVDPLEIFQVRRQGEGEHPQSPVRDHPRWNLKTAFVPEDEVAMPILGTLDRFDVLEIRESSLEMCDPLPETIGRTLPQISDDPGEIGAVRLETRSLAWRTRLADKEAIQNNLLDA